MSHKLKCPGCRAALSLGASVPARIRCPKCGKAFTPELEADDEDSRPEVDSENSDDDAAPRSASRRERDDDDDRDNRSSRSKSRAGGRDRDDDGDNDDRSNRKARSSKKKSAEKKKFPIWLPITIGGAALVTV